MSKPTHSGDRQGPAPNAAEVQRSPSLDPGDGPRPDAYELKFAADERQRRRVEEMAAELLLPDPHGKDGAYRLSTLYLDTEDLAVYHRDPLLDGTKYRIRRYDGEPRCWLERKQRRGDRVSKQRSLLDGIDLRLLNEEPRDSETDEAWFVGKVRSLRLRPICQIDYERRAYYHAVAGAPGRLTLDRCIAGRPAGAFAFDPEVPTTAVLEGITIVEVKFRGELPLALKRIVNESALAPTGISKYRRVVRSLSLEI